MKRTRPKEQAGSRAFTLLELLLVIAIALILVAVSWPVSGPRPKSVTVHCMSNLKQIALGCLMWQSDHDGALPWEVDAINAGTRDVIEHGLALPHFESIANYIKEPQVFTCPGDRERSDRFNKEGRLTAGGLSYFVNLDAVTNTWTSVLAGDRQLKLDGQPVRPGLVTVTTNAALSWLPGIHIKGATSGNLAFMDGHVESARDNLNELFRTQVVGTNRLVVP